MSFLAPGPWRSLVLAVVHALALGACECGSGGSEPASSSSSSSASGSSSAPETDEPEFADMAGGITWRAEEPLVSRRPSSPMRAAEYVVRGHDGAELTVFHFGTGQGGSVDDNVQRWVGQFTQPGGGSSADVAQIDRQQINGFDVTTVDVRGTYSAMSAGGASSGPREGQRLLGAIVEAPQGMVFFKLTGSEDAVGEAEEAFGALLRSVRSASH